MPSAWGAVRRTFTLGWGFAFVSLFNSGGRDIQVALRTDDMEFGHTVAERRPTYQKYNRREMQCEERR